MRKLGLLLLLACLPGAAQVTVTGSTIITGAGGGGGCAPFCALINVANVFTLNNTFPSLTVNGGVNGLPVYENTGLFNIGLGVDSVPTNATGSQNLGIGDGTLQTLTTGYDNTSIGVAANGGVTTGGENTGVGTFALQSNQTGIGNTGIGSLALADTTGSYNVGIGNLANGNLTSGSNTVSIGSFSGCGTLCSSSSGPITQLNNSVYIGFQAGASANSLTNQILIGYNIQSSVSNQMILGDPAITATTIYGVPTMAGLAGGGSGCVGIDNTGLESVTSCGSGGGGSAIQVNGVNLLSSATANFVNGTNVAITNPTLGNINIAVSSIPFSGVVSGTSSGTLLVSGSLAATGGGTLTATAMPYSGLIGSVPTWNQNTTGNAATATALASAPTTCSSGNAPQGVDVHGNAVNCQAISGGGGGATLQTNSVNNSSQTLLNFTNTASILFSNTSGGIEQATLSGGANTLAGFNSGNAYTNFTLGAGLGFSGSTLVNTGFTGTLSPTNCIPKGTAATTLGCSAMTDNASQISSSEPIAVTGTTPGATDWAAGTGSLLSAPPNSYGIIGPATGGTPYDQQYANTASATGGFWLFGAPGTVNGRNVIQGTQAHMEYAIASGVYNFGANSLFAVVASDVPLNNGHFTELVVNTVGAGGGCTTPPQFEAFDNNANSAPATASTSQTFQNGAQVKLPLTLPFSAGDNIGIVISTAGAGCPAPTAFSVIAHVSIP